MRAVLWDMDGTLVDSEKHWDVAMHALYDRLGGVLTPEVREATVGGSAEGVMRIVYADLGLEPDPVDMSATADWLHDYTADLFDQGLPWCEGARELLEALAIEGVPMALVTNTRRSLTERALNSIGRQYFSATVCGDEVAAGKPAPDPYLRAAVLLGESPDRCLAIEDSGDRHRFRGKRRLPGVGGTQRRRRAARPAASAHLGRLPASTSTHCVRSTRSWITSWRNAPPDPLFGA